MRVYFDNASTTPLTEGVLEALTSSYQELYGNPSSIHQFGRVARAKLENARKIIANGLNASVGEIFFTSSATEANNMILKRSIIDLGVKRIISSPTEHHCILHSLDYIEQQHQEVEVIYLNVDSLGLVDIDQLNKLLEDDVSTLVSIMYVNNEIGIIQDIPQIAYVCKDHGALFHCDAVQWIAKSPLDVQQIPFSFITASAHKFHGPKGIGFMYMNNDNILQPYIHGGAQERNIRAGTENLHGIIAMAHAFEEALKEMDERREKIHNLKTHFIVRATSELADIKINGSSMPQHSAPHILSISFPPTDKADMLMFNLDIGGICASSGSACSSGIEQDSHVLIATGHPTERKSIRFSFSHMNTIEEVDYTINALRKMTPTL